VSLFSNQIIEVKSLVMLLLGMHVCCWCWIDKSCVDGIYIFVCVVMSLN